MAAFLLKGYTRHKSNVGGKRMPPKHNSVIILSMKTLYRIFIFISIKSVKNKRTVIVYV